MDPSDAIAAVTMKSLLPAVLNWIWESDKLYMEMMPGILAKVLNLLTRKPFSPSTNHQTLVSGDCEMLPPSVVQQRKVNIVLISPKSALYFITKVTQVLSLFGDPSQSARDIDMLSRQVHIFIRNQILSKNR